MDLFVYMAKLWTTYLQEGLSCLSSVENVEQSLVSLEMSRNCLKSGYFTVYEWENERVLSH